MKTSFRLLVSTLALAAAGSFSAAASAQTALLNVSYDVAREFYRDFNTAFVAHYKKTTGKDIKVDQSHAGSLATGSAVGAAGSLAQPAASATAKGSIRKGERMRDTS